MMSASSFFRLLSTLLFLLISAAATAQSSNEEHEQAVAALAQLGGKVYKEKDGTVQVLLWFDWKGGGDDLVHLKKLIKVTRLDLRSDKFNDDALAHVKDLGDLKLLILE